MDRDEIERMLKRSAFKGADLGAGMAFTPLAAGFAVLLAELARNGHLSPMQIQTVCEAMRGLAETHPDNAPPGFGREFVALAHSTIDGMEATALKAVPPDPGKGDPPAAPHRPRSRPDTGL